ncbi:sodium-dependent transporter [Candidatus Woesearchaeota archaeon]|nr:sodium-dependent transporter [Candidatus Woesearchaeota archaeon]
MRERWGSKLTFIIVSVGSAAGLGNIWRFPYLVGTNGGGAFLLPYILLLFLLGIPLLMLEFGLGQKMQRGAVDAFSKIKAKWGGIGFGALLVGFVVSTYYTVIMAWTLLYAWYATGLQWGSDPTSFFNNALQVGTPGVITAIVPSVVIALLLVWTVVFFSVWKGVKAIGRITKVVVLVPVAILLLLLVQGLFLPNAWEGIAYYITPNFHALLNIQVWMAALGQIFFSLSVGFGIMIAYASYQDRKSDITKNAVIIALSDAFIAIISGFVVFSTLGFMAAKQGVPVEELAHSGPSLVFMVFPQALNLMPYATFFAVIFFAMLFMLGLSSQISMTEAIITSFADRMHKWNKQLLTFFVCAVTFAIGLIYATDSGLFILDIVDHFVNYGLILVGLLEVLVIGWIFGAERLRTFIDNCSEWHVGRHYNTLIRFIAPALIIILLINQLLADTPLGNIVGHYLGIESIFAPYGDYSTSLLLLFGWSVLAAIIVASILFGILQHPKPRRKKARGTTRKKPPAFARKKI